jgi:Lipopolysaccharide kinase (Kdo/WaaP) family
MSNVRLAQKIARNINTSWPKPVKYLGGGVNGRVYMTNNGRLMKFIYDYAPQEYEALSKLQGTFVVPRFKKGNGHTMNLNENLSEEVQMTMFPNAYGNSNSLTVFIMGRVGNANSTTLRKYINKHPGANRSAIARRVAHLIKEMHVRGISHGNLHGDNIIVSADSAGRITGMWAIDFGRSRKIPLGKTEMKMYKTMKTTSQHPTYSLYGKTTKVPVYNGSRSNVSMLGAIASGKMAKGVMKRIAQRRKNVSNEMKQYKSPKKTSSPRRTKSLSPRGSGTRSSPTRPRSAPARIATPQKGLKVRFSMKRKRA